ncbi:MAG TPA: hypothetical protein VFO52_05205 [Longimicrobiales bacterium]|nr:hypothetical protein [Longimicrobiales bacterium]
MTVRATLRCHRSSACILAASGNRIRSLRRRDGDVGPRDEVTGSFVREVFVRIAEVVRAQPRHDLLTQFSSAFRLRGQSIGFPS